MPNHAVLDNVAHKDVRIITRRAAELGDNVAAVGVFPIELRALQGEYPIVFRKMADGRFEPVALLGLAPGENLFLRHGGWDARVLPLSIERQPFLIGGEGDSVHIDMDSPRVSRSEGEPVFLELGGVSPYLERMRSVLLAIHEGHAANRALSDALVAAELFEPLVLDVALKNGARHKLAGFHIVDEERLAALDAETVARLHRAGHLAAIYMAVASFGNFGKLVAWKNERI